MGYPFTYSRNEAPAEVKATETKESGDLFDSRREHPHGSGARNI